MSPKCKSLIVFFSSSSSATEKKRKKMTKNKKEKKKKKIVSIETHSTYDGMRRPMDTNGNQHFYFDSFCLVRLNSTDAINNFSLALRFSLTSCGGRIFQYVLKNYLMFVSNFFSAFPILSFVKKSNQMLHFSRHFFHIFFFSVSVLCWHHRTHFAST